MSINQALAKCLLLISLLMGVVFLTHNSPPHTITAAPPPTPQPKEPTPEAVSPRGNPIQSAAPISDRNRPLDYCPSNGGSTQYEHIRSVRLTPRANGSYQLEVQLFIDNPTGCSTGEECPEYDDSPEYVNAWIDWNGNQVWEPSEKIMDSELTGYLSINYSGHMTAIAQIVPPSNTVETTWLRANVGWLQDPDDPCTLNWDWGHVMDRHVALNPPQIKEILVEGSRDPYHPMSNYPVTVEALLYTPPGYIVERVSWAGDLKPGTGNPYTYHPNPGTHGLKHINATVTYKHLASGLLKRVTEEHQFKLFFEKKGDDDHDSIPNWFEYWAADGAVPSLNNPLVTFDPTKGDSSYGTWNPNTDQVELGPAAAEIHYPNGITIEGITYGNFKGIDSVAEIIAHELRHRLTIQESWEAGGNWNGMTDSDFHSPTTDYFDYLPNIYEYELGTNENHVDSKDLEHLKSPVYRFYGDNEFDAMVVSHGQSGNADNDWANPGKQSYPPFGTTRAPSTLAHKTSGPVTETSDYQLSSSRLLSELAQLTNDYSDIGIDTRGNSAYETLRFNIGLHVIDAGNYNLIGWLQDNEGNDIAWAQHATYLEVGNHQIDLHFDGTLIQQYGINGPYTLKKVEVRIGDHGNLVDEALNVYTTQPYDGNDFAPPDVTFNNSYSENVQDINNDNFYDWLHITVDLQVHMPSSYTLIGWLYDANDNPIPNASASTSFTDSGSHTLTFDGHAIRWAHADGPYMLRNLEIRDEQNKPIAFKSQAYTTAAYTHAHFQTSHSTIDTTTFSDQGIDVDQDGDFDYLQVHFQINSSQPGDYQLTAALQDNAGTAITELTQEITLITDTTDLTLNFISGPIYQHAVTGTYQIATITLLDSQGTIIDNLPLAHTTTPYNPNDFSPPLITLLPTRDDYPVDTDEDGTYDTLNIDVSVIPGNNGVIVAQGFLVDRNQTIIQKITTNIELEAGSTQTITLPFNATLIQENGEDGPFKLENLLVYHTGDPSQAVSVLSGYHTAPYDHETLEINAQIFLPMVRR